MSGRKCKNCGSSDIEVDPARGDAVCTNCGSVLEHSIIVSEVQFEEGAHGTSNVIGQFVSADSGKGVSKFGAAFHIGLGLESREITLKKAKSGITRLCHQLQLNQHCIDTACNFFRLALGRNLTRGRRNTHVHAACVYLTCRTEGTAHLLIDISDVLQICCYELGRTYLKLSQALHIRVPAVDPCLYILRFAAKLQFGNKTQLVANTALRLVQRMKRDSIHSGRRPSGLCGAALLIAARLHEFSRTANDIVKIVKVHESTLRKRLIEFGDTPSSALTLEEFMTVDLEQEQDPPSFKAARKKDKERLQKVLDDEADKISQFQKEIEEELEKESKTVKRNRKTSKKNPDALERQDTARFIKESTVGTIQEILKEEATVDNPADQETVEGLGPDIASMGLVNSLHDTSNATTEPESSVNDELITFDDIDDDEIDAYIMNENECKTKNALWLERNATYLEEQRLREERLRQEREEGKPEKKRRRAPRKRNIGPVNSAGEAIEKILQEKKISTKINYDVLKSLTAPAPASSEPVVEDDPAPTTSESIKRRRLNTVSNLIMPTPIKTKRQAASLGLPYVPCTKTESIPKAEQPENVSEEEAEDDAEEDEQVQDQSDDFPSLLRFRNQDPEEPEEYGEQYEYDGYDDGDGDW